MFGSKIFVGTRKCQILDPYFQAYKEITSILPLFDCFPLRIRHKN